MRMWLSAKTMLIHVRATDCWLRGESAKEVIAATKVRIDEAAHDDADIYL